MGDKKSKKGFCSHQFQFNHIIIVDLYFFVCQLSNISLTSVRS